MDATADQASGFNGEAVEGTEPEQAVELVGEDLPSDLAVTRSEDGPDTRSSGGPGPLASTRSGSGDHLEEGETAAGVLAHNMLSDEARYNRWQARRPLVGHLRPGVAYPPGTSGPVPLFDVGDRLVVEARSTDLGPRRTDPLDPEGPPRWPWFRTVVGRVLSIDDDTGEVVLDDEEACQRLGCARRLAYARFGSDPELQAFYLAPRAGDPFDASAVLAERREEARRAAEALAGAPGAPARRGRGRPPGSKNRPKEEIQAERELIEQARRERKNRRAAQRAGL